MRWWEVLFLAIAVAGVAAVWYLAWHMLEALEFHRRYHHRQTRYRR